MPFKLHTKSMYCADTDFSAHLFFFLQWVDLIKRCVELHICCTYYLINIIQNCVACLFFPFVDFFPSFAKFLKWAFAGVYCFPSAYPLFLFLITCHLASIPLFEDTTCSQQSNSITLSKLTDYCWPFHHSF